MSPDGPGTLNIRLVLSYKYFALSGLVGNQLLPWFLKYRILIQGEVMGICQYSLVSGDLIWKGKLEWLSLGILPLATCLSSLRGHEQSGAGYDFSDFYLLFVLYLLRVFLPLSSLIQKLTVVRPTGNREEGDLFLYWSEITQMRIIDKQSNFSKQWHSGSKFPVSHLENLTELGIGMQSHFLCQ